MGMTATEKLRHMLDDRDVTWIEGNDPETTAWYDGSHVVRADEYDGQLLVERVMTPEQAIAATLGNDGPERSNDGVAVTCVPDDYTAKLMAEVARLEGENARLRELVRDMWPHVCHRSRMCRECELPCRETSDECLLYEPMRQRMRELGIEVDA
jgi:hypothetical protein